MVRGVRNALMLVIATAVLPLFVSGCAAKGPVYVSANRSYTQASAPSVFALADTSRLADQPASTAPKLRHTALAALRRSGADASAISNLLTRVFPGDTRGVPVYVERATYDGKSAVLVVEATGPESGKLASKRLWVSATTGTYCSRVPGSSPTRRA